jgi:hypothetical protein
MSFGIKNDCRLPRFLCRWFRQGSRSCNRCRLRLQAVLRQQSTAAMAGCSTHDSERQRSETCPLQDQASQSTEGHPVKYLFRIGGIVLIVGTIAVAFINLPSQPSQFVLEDGAQAANDDRGESNESEVPEPGRGFERDSETEDSGESTEPEVTEPSFQRDSETEDLLQMLGHTHAYVYSYRGGVLDRTIHRLANERGQFSDQATRETVVNAGGELAKCSGKLLVLVTKDERVLTSRSIRIPTGKSSGRGFVTSPSSSLPLSAKLPKFLSVSESDDVKVGKGDELFLELRWVKEEE